MILVAGGDSFVFGAELADQTYFDPSMSTYTALLAKQSNLEYYCAAHSGNANNAITRMTMTACENFKKQNKDVCAIVTWTFTNRYEFRFNHDTQQKISPWYSINAWSIIDDTKLIENEFVNKNYYVLEKQKDNINRAKLTGISDFAKTFFMHVGDNEYYELYSSLKEILFLQQYFKQNSIPYLFLPADNHFYQHPNYYRRQDEFVDAIYDQIDWDKWFFFESGTEAGHTKEPRGFYQWAIENKYPIGTTHPLEQAHRAAADLLKEKFNDMVTQSNKPNSIRNTL
jgi:hypothetical protein